MSIDTVTLEPEATLGPHGVILPTARIGAKVRGSALSANHRVVRAGALRGSVQGLTGLPIQ